MGIWHQLPLSLVQPGSSKSQEVWLRKYGSLRVVLQDTMIKHRNHGALNVVKSREACKPACHGCDVCRTGGRWRPVRVAKRLTARFVGRSIGRRLRSSSRRLAVLRSDVSNPSVNRL
jgi:hypothetical protein